MVPSYLEGADHGLPQLGDHPVLALGRVGELAAVLVPLPAAQHGVHPGGFEVVLGVEVVHGAEVAQELEVVVVVREFLFKQFKVSE
jgi:hypothetical protein